MEPVYGFPPVADKNARILILGSMPGRASLQASQYYAHPRNAFWPIMTELLALAPDTSYSNKQQALRSAGIALWDVLHACERSGSLDANIVASSRITNDFSTFFNAHPHIRQIFFNGGEAERVFKRFILPTLHCPADVLIRLPSTSPANASMNFSQKLAAWRVIMQP